MGTEFEETRKIGLQFSEKMAGYLTEGETDFEQGERAGKSRNNQLLFEVTVHVEEVSDFCKLSGRKAQLTGTVSYKPLGQNLPIRNGEFSLFRPDPATGKRHMTYSFGFTGDDGQDCFLYGYKVIYDDPHKVDMLEDMTRLFTRIYKGTSAEGSLLGSGILHFRCGACLPCWLPSKSSTPILSLTGSRRFLSFSPSATGKSGTPTWRNTAPSTTRSTKTWS